MFHQKNGPNPQSADVAPVEMLDFLRRQSTEKKKNLSGMATVKGFCDVKTDLLNNPTIILLKIL